MNEDLLIFNFSSTMDPSHRGENQERQDKHLDDKCSKEYVVLKCIKYDNMHKHKIK